MRSPNLCTGASALAVLLALAAPASAAALQGFGGGNQASSQTPAAPPSSGYRSTGPAAAQQNQASSQSAAPDAPTATAPASGTDYMPSSVAPVPAAAPMSMAEMQERIEELQRQLEFMKQVAAEQTAGVSAVQARPAVTLPNGRPTFATADGNFSATLNGVIQFDAGNYYQNNGLPAGIAGAARDLNGGTNARRARLGFGGKVFGDFDYNILTEFGGSGTENTGAIQELWLQYTGFLKPFHARVGYFEPLIGMEANVSTNSIALMERASPAEVSRNIAAGDARAALQVFGNSDFNKLSFDEGKGKVHWLASGAVTGNSVSVLNTAGTAFVAQPFDEQLGVLGRVAVAPYHGDDYTVHFGAHGQYVVHPNDNSGRGTSIVGRYTAQLRDRPELRIDGTRLVDTGPLNANHVYEAGAEFGFQFKNFYGQAEYFHYAIDGDGAVATPRSPSFDGYYIEGSYIFTGEHRVYNPANGAFNGPAVAHPFSWKDRTFGALELAGRFSDLDLNYNAGSGGATPRFGVRGGEQKSYTVSFNWYLNPIVRFMLQGQHVDIDRLTAAGLPLGQDYNTIAVRSQLAF